MPSPSTAVGWPDDRLSDPRLPLTGTRVLDLSRILAGPLAAMLLGDLGADVLKVERPGDGDETRRWGPPFHGDDAAYFTAVNRNRRSVTVDLTSPEGQAAVAGWATAADVVIENFLPRQLEALGLEGLRRTATRTVWVSVRGAAAGGPLASTPGYDAMVQARAGFMAVTGHPESGPAKVGVPVVDVLTGLYAAVAALAGLHARDHRPEAPAPRLEAPLFECAVAALVNQAANHLVGGEAPGLLGNDHPNIAPYGPIPTADGDLVVGAASNRQFDALVTAAGVPHLAEDPRFASNAARVANRAALAAELAAAFGQAPSAEWEHRLARADVPCAPVNSVPAVFEEAQLRASGLLQRVEHPAGPLTLVGCPLTVDGVRPSVRRPPPRLGEHNDEVLGAGLEEVDDG